MEATNVILEERSFKLAKDKTKLIGEMYIPVNYKKANKIYECGRILYFYLKEHTVTKEQKLKLDRMFTCKDRFCPFCNWRRQLKYSKLIYAYLSNLQQQRPLRYIFLTLTVPNCRISDLRRTIEHMNKSFQRMTKTKRWNDSILGYLRVLEYTIEKKNSSMIHPHFHVLLAVEPRYFVDERYINQQEFLAMWRKATRDDKIVAVDVRIVKPNKDKSANAAAVAELCKYPMKDTDLSRLSTDNFRTLVYQLRHIRNINAGGILKGILKSVDTIDNDLIHINEELDEGLWVILKEVLYRYETRDGVTDYFLIDNRNDE